MSDEEVDACGNTAAQWSTTCDDCDNVVEYFCKSCQTKFCTACRKGHLSSKRFRHHEVVPYKSGMKSGTQSTCPDHPGERYQLYCEPCAVPICVKCITEKHAKHECSNITEAYELLRNKAIAQLELKSTKIKPQLQEMLTSFEEKQLYSNNAVAELEQEMRTSAQRVIKEMNDLLDVKIKELHKMHSDNIVNPLRRGIQETKDRIANTDREITSYEENLRSTDPVDLLKFMKDQEDDDSSGIGSFRIDVDQLLPTFTPGQISRINLQQQFGKLALTGDNSNPSDAGTVQEGDSKEGLSKEADLTRSHDAMPDERNMMSDTRMMRLPATPVCQSQFTYSDNPYGIRLLASDRAWIYGNTTRLDLVERSGKVLRTVDARCKLYGNSDKYVTDDGDMIYSDIHNKCIRIVSPSGQVSILFRVDSFPLGLSRLMNGELAIGMDGVIRIYTEDGRDIREVGKGRVKEPYYITTNRLTEDICVSDDNKKVVVFTEDGEYRYTYSGQRRSGNFNPWDLCSDLQGHLIITDCKNHCIHILDQNGQFIQYLATQKDGINCPISIDVDYQGCVWVGEGDSKQVKIIKYL